MKKFSKCRDIQTQKKFLVEKLPMMIPFVMVAFGVPIDL